MKFKNFTPHTIVLNDGTEFVSVGVARVSSTHTEFDADKICTVEFGAVVGLPAPEAGVTYIVSALVAARAAAEGRDDVVSPATGHKETKRVDGQVISVPGFVRAQ